MTFRIERQSATTNLLLAATLLGSTTGLAYAEGFELNDVTGERGQSVSLPLVFSEDTRTALNQNPSASLTVLGLPVDAWLSAGTATGRGWRIDGPAVVTAMNELQITTTPGEKSDHLVEFQLRMTAKDQPLSRLMALSLKSNQPNVAQRVASRAAPTPGTLEPEAQPGTKVRPEPAPVPVNEQVASKAEAPPVKKPETEPPATVEKNDAASPIRSAPARLAALIPKLWKSPKPVPSGLGASNINPEPSEKSAVKAEDRLAALPAESKPTTSIKVQAAQPTSRPVVSPQRTPVANPPQKPQTDPKAERAAPMFIRAKAMAEAGDVAGARLLYAHLANNGNASAAFEMARTFESDFLQQRKVWGLKPDSSEAEQWYAKARELGYANIN